MASTTCPGCNGTGKAPRGVLRLMRRCMRCTGTGSVWAPNPVRTGVPRVVEEDHRRAAPATSPTDDFLSPVNPIGPFGPLIDAGGIWGTHNHPAPEPERHHQPEQSQPHHHHNCGSGHHHSHDSGSSSHDSGSSYDSGSSGSDSSSSFDSGSSGGGCDS